MRIKNNSTYVNRTGMQRAVYSFYTSDDAEVKLRHENEWYQRIYWQGVETFDKGGYVVFDTFTYDNEHLPRLKHYFDESTLTGIDKDGKEKYFGNYGCFNREHFPKFMKDLRTDLASAGFDVKDNVKYVYTTEYGTERVYEDRRGTHVATLRPHYHLMLFVSDPTLDPDTLNQYIEKHWFYGFHGNGKSRAEFKRNTFDSGMNAIDRKVHLRGLANYIGKYMHKSSDYEEIIGKRIKAIAYKMCPIPTFTAKSTGFVAEKDMVVEDLLGTTPKEYHLNAGDVVKGFDVDKKEIKLHSDWKQRFKICYGNAYKKIATFHGQSQHFGEYALREPNFDINEVAETGKMRMPDKKKVVRFIPIPLYYRRKLFYKQVTNDQGKLAWVLKDDEVSHKFYRNMTYRQSGMLADVYKNIYRSLPLQDRIKVDCWMNGRNMNDLATYEVFFKDCFFDCDTTGLTTEDVLDIRLSQDFTRKDVNGNERNIGWPIKRICQNDNEDFAHFDDVLKVFEPYLQDRHREFNETFKTKEHEYKIIK